MAAAAVAATVLSCTPGGTQKLLLLLLWVLEQLTGTRAPEYGKEVDTKLAVLANLEREL